MAKLGEEREHNLIELNQKRVQHVTTLQQMGKISWNNISPSQLYGEYENDFLSI